MIVNRPTLSLAVIAKNEGPNVARLLNSVQGCFDEIIFVDTGSTDNTKEEAKKFGCKIFDFPWIRDFSAARNFALDQVKTDYVMWMDLDDTLKNKEAFILWRDTAMEFGDYWLANYNYAIDAQDKPIISFMRERVFSMKIKPRFQYFIHEGVVPQAGANIRTTSTWAIDHRRTLEDVKKDDQRNLLMLEERKHTLDGRMMFYFGKELYENKKFDRAVQVFTDALIREDLQAHDRLMAFQYAGYSAVAWAEQMLPEHRPEKYMLAIELANKGLLLDNNRAELHCIIGECYAKLGNLAAALPSYAAATKCTLSNASMSGALFIFKQCYNEHPLNEMAKIYYNMGNMDMAKACALESFTNYNSEIAKQMLLELDKIIPLIKLDGPRTKTEDIVITCPPNGAYEFDSGLYKEKGMGGSETACIEMATWLRRLTKRPVKVFNMRQRDYVDEDGVEYISTNKVNEYMGVYSPAVHIAWRHNIKLTNSPTYLWCHDLYTPGTDIAHNFDKHFCLSEFHKRYVMSMMGVPAEKIIVTRNGLNPDKFKFKRKDKDPNKIVWMSSPDRGLDRCMVVCDELRKEFPDIKLHVYYGLDNLYKYGMKDLADKLTGMMAERPWVVYHGFTEQKKMYQEVSDAVIWMHPCTFIESYCITALEMQELGIYSITRPLGALQDTLKDAVENGKASFIYSDRVINGMPTEEAIKDYVKEAGLVLREKKWENVSLDIDKFSWKSLAENWIKLMEL